MEFFRQLRDQLQSDRDTRPDALAKLADANLDLADTTGGDRQRCRRDPVVRRVDRRPGAARPRLSDLYRLQWRSGPKPSRSGRIFFPNRSSGRSVRIVAARGDDF